MPGTAATPAAWLTPEEASPPAPPAVADLAVEMPEQIEIGPGGTAIYTLTLRNDGPNVATGIVLTGTFPNGVTAVRAGAAGAACRQGASGIDCDLGELAAGSATTVTLDLSGSEVEPILASKRGDGTGHDLPWLTCATHRAGAPPQVTCLLSSLPAGSEIAVRVGMDVSSPLTGDPVHTVAVAGSEVDPVRANNHGTSRLVASPAQPADAAAAAPDLVVEGEGPARVNTGEPFTYTYAITNRGTSAASGVWFQDEIPSDTDLVAYAPGLPECAQHGDALTCQLQAPGAGESVTFTLAITGYGAQPLEIELDPLLPGWPSCFVIKEQTWQHFLVCEIGVLQPGQTTAVRLALTAIGSQPRTTSNTVSVHLAEPDPTPLDNTSTVTITVQAGEED